MRRKPVDLVPITLRIPQALRRRLGEHADRNRASLNNEMARRLQESFELKAIEQITADLQRAAAVVRKRLQPAE